MAIEFKEQIGSAGMTGTVWHAVDTDFNRDVAVKFFHSHLGQLRDQISRHAAALTRVSHPNVVTIFSIADLVRPGTNGEAEPAIIMEYVPGQTFGEWLAGDNLTKEEVLAVVEGILNGVEALHKSGVPHG